MMRQADTRKTTMIEVISFLFFTLFAMILAFFTSAKAFAGPDGQAIHLNHRAAPAMVAPVAPPRDTGARLPF